MNNIYENKFIINDYSNEDYEIDSAILKQRLDIDSLVIDNSLVNLDTINYFINDTNIKNIILNNCEIIYETKTLINIEKLVLNNVRCNDYEFLMYFIGLINLEINNLESEFNCYYLRKLTNLKELKLSNLKVLHLGGLGYLNELNILYLNNVPIKNWIFTTKLLNLKTLYLSSEYDLSGVPKLLFEIKKETKN